jgi:hypothetical protein
MALFPVLLVARAELAVAGPGSQQHRVDFE